MKLNLKNVGIGMLLGFVILLLVGIVFILSYLRSFTKTAGISTKELITIARNGIESRDRFTNRTVPFLFLGLDRRADEFEKTTLTDTILLGSLNTATGRLTTIPLPRDLWIPELQTKINALYFYGKDRPNTSSLEFTKQELGKITGVTPEFVAVLNYLELPALIDLVGGVDILIEKSFEDSKYPNPEYITNQEVTQYITIEFKQGIEHMDGERALAFIRSRGSSDPEEGSDTARSKRQMIVLSTLIKKLKSREVLQDPQITGNLYRFWNDKIETTLTDEQAVAVALSLRKHAISISSAQIPTTSSSSQKALLVNPSISKYGLWVWEARDRSWGELKEFIRSNL